MTMPAIAPDERPLSAGFDGAVLLSFAVAVGASELAALLRWRVVVVSEGGIDETRVIDDGADDEDREDEVEEDGCSVVEAVVPGTTSVIVTGPVKVKLRLERSSGTRRIRFCR